ncbi:hypothetical protein LIER_43575 [Lithospermum erythrorhizon]|uniref:Uncharacterized protein n=1 Tax=Lithospermum erythrorhizon TaxID=34254 RepID=A0AAV3QC81_LITER
MSSTNQIISNISPHTHTHIFAVGYYTKPFKFQPFWIDHPEYNEVIRMAWNKHDEGNGMDILYCRMKSVKEELRKLNASKFSNISSRVAEKQIRDGNDKLIEDLDGIKEVAIQFYKNLFTEPSNNGCDLSRVENILDQNLKNDEVIMLGMPVTAQEIKEVILHMNLGKAPGPDGFTTKFYKGS